MQQDLAEFDKAGIRVVGVSYDKVDVLKKFADQQKITFPLLSDPGSKVIEAYGLYNGEATGTRIEGVPYPGTIVIGSDGKVIGKRFYDGYKDRHSADEIIATAGDRK